METLDTSAPHDRRVPPENDDEWAVEPLKPKRTPRTLKEIERLLAGLHIAIATDLDVAKREILQRIAAVETSVESIARELEHKGREADENVDRSDSR